MTVAAFTPTEAARWHAANRAWKRYGLAVAIPDLHAAEKRIWAGRARWLEDQRARNGNLRQAYRTKLKGELAVVVFDISIEAIVTVLPWASAGRMKRRQHLPPRSVA